MIVDDSTVARAVLSRMVESDPVFEIAAVAGSCRGTRSKRSASAGSTSSCSISKCPGQAASKSIPRIIAAAGGAKVMIVSSLAEDGAEQTVAALALGAADTLPKPGTGRFNGKFSEILLAKLKALGYADGAVAASDCSQGRDRTACFGRCQRTRSTSSRSALRPAAFMRSERCSAVFRSGSACRSLSRSILPIAVHERVRAPAGRCRAPRCRGCARWHGACRRPHPDRAWRRAPHSRARARRRGCAP